MKVQIETAHDPDRPHMALRFGVMTTPASEHPGHEIRRNRFARGWSQAELAQRAGVGVRTIRRVEAGEGDPDSRTITRLRHTLGLSTTNPRDLLATLSDVDRAELIAWALAAATDLEWLEALGRRLGATPERAKLPNQDLRLPRRNSSDQHGESGA